MSFKLGVVGKQHNKLRIFKPVYSFRKIPVLAHSKKLFHTAASPFLFRSSHIYTNLIILENDWNRQCFLQKINMNVCLQFFWKGIRIKQAA